MRNPNVRGPLKAFWFSWRRRNPGKIWWAIEAWAYMMMLWYGLPPKAWGWARGKAYEADARAIRQHHEKRRREIEKRYGVKCDA